MKSAVGGFANNAVHALNGARALEPAKAAKQLRDLMRGVDFPRDVSIVSDNALQAYRSLIQTLEAKQAASDDDWQQAIEKMSTLAGQES